MRYYAHYGHKEFILCLGNGGDYIKKYFLDYNECISNDFVLSKSGKEIELIDSDISDWKITFIDTGLNSNIGQRLVAVKHLLGDDEVFMANYADGVSDLDMDAYLSNFYRQGKIASFLSVKPSQSFHVVEIEKGGVVQRISPVALSEVWINGGFFVFKKEVFDYIHEGEELVQEPFYRLISEKQLITYQNPGFWACIDTLKEKKMFDDMYAAGVTPWMVWRNNFKKEIKQGRLVA